MEVKRLVEFLKEIQLVVEVKSSGFECVDLLHTLWRLITKIACYFSCCLKQNSIIGCPLQFQKTAFKCSLLLRDSIIQNHFTFFRSEN